MEAKFEREIWNRRKACAWLEDACSDEGLLSPTAGWRGTPGPAVELGCGSEKGEGPE